MRGSLCRWSLCLTKLLKLFWAITLIIAKARELEILCRILALIILGAVIYLFTEEEDSDPVKHKVVYSVLILSLIIILFVSNKICKIRHNERAKMMATQNELQQTIIAYNKANTERVKAETEK